MFGSLSGFPIAFFCFPSLSCVTTHARSSRSWAKFHPAYGFDFALLLYARFTVYPTCIQHKNARFTLDLSNTFPVLSDHLAVLERSFIALLSFYASLPNCRQGKCFHRSRINKTLDELVQVHFSSNRRLSWSEGKRDLQSAKLTNFTLFFSMDREPSSFMNNSNYISQEKAMKCILLLS